MNAACTLPRFIALLHRNVLTSSRRALEQQQSVAVGTSTFKICYLQELLSCPPTTPHSHSNCLHWLQIPQFLILYTCQRASSFRFCYKIYSEKNVDNSADKVLLTLQLSRESSLVVNIWSFITPWITHPVPAPSHVERSLVIDLQDINLFWALMIQLYKHIPLNLTKSVPATASHANERNRNKYGSQWDKYIRTAIFMTSLGIEMK